MSKLTTERWRQWTEWPMAFAAVAFLVVYSIQVIATTSVEERKILSTAIWVLWTLFLVDYLVTLMTVENKWRWFLRNIHELAILALPFLRPLRLLRLITLVRAINRVAGSALRGKIVFYVIGASVLLVYTGALAVLDAERADPQANITNIGDALWWAFTTITTVGYGDHFPVTDIGHLVAAGLMLGGIAVLSVVTASVASWLVEAVATQGEEEQNNMSSETILNLSEQVSALSRQIENLSKRLESR